MLVHVASRRKWSLLVATTMGVIALSSTAFAGNEAAVSTAREIAKEGLSAYEAGRYAEADEKLTRALDVVGVPTLALFTARANVKLGHLVRASELYLLATRLDAKGPSESVQLQAQRDAAKERADLLPRIPRLTIALEGADLEEVEVTLDGQAVPKSILGTPQLVDPGVRTIAGTRGSEQVLSKVEVTEREHKTTKIRFVKSEPNHTGRPSTFVTKSEPQSRPISSMPLALPPPTSGHAPYQSAPAQTMSLQRTLGWVGVGVGAASVAFGGISGLLAISKHNSLQSGGCQGSACYTDQSGAVDTLNRYRMMSTIGFVAGGVFAATGVTLLLTARNNEHPQTGLTLTPGTVHVFGEF